MILTKGTNIVQKCTVENFALIAVVVYLIHIPSYKPNEIKKNGISPTLFITEPFRENYYSIPKIYIVLLQKQSCQFNLFLLCLF